MGKDLGLELGFGFRETKKRERGWISNGLEPDKVLDLRLLGGLLFFFGFGDKVWGERERERKIKRYNWIWTWGPLNFFYFIILCGGRTTTTSPPLDRTRGIAHWIIMDYLSEGAHMWPFLFSFSYVAQIQQVCLGSSLQPPSPSPIALSGLSPVRRVFSSS